MKALVETQAPQRKAPLHPHYGTKADALSFFFPVSWWYISVIPKGWVNRVLSRGFTFACERRISTGKVPYFAAVTE